MIGFSKKLIICSPYRDTPPLNTGDFKKIMHLCDAHLQLQKYLLIWYKYVFFKSLTLNNDRTVYCNLQLSCLVITRHWMIIRAMANNNTLFHVFKARQKNHLALMRLCPQAGDRDTIVNFHFYKLFCSLALNNDGTVYYLQLNRLVITKERILVGTKLYSQFDKVYFNYFVFLTCIIYRDSLSLVIAFTSLFTILYKHKIWF